jgi:hypothetical protein
LIKSPIGILLAAAGVILAVSPDARKAVRKIAVKGTEWILDLNDQLKAGIKEVQMVNDRSGNSENPATNGGILSTELQSHIDQ